MKPAPFVYERPSSTEEALRILADHGDEAKILAGGQSLVPMLNMRLSIPERLIDVNRLGMDHVVAENGALRLGGMVRQRTLEHDPIIATRAPLVAAAVPLIGHPAIRARGTLGGSVAHADPAAELPAVMCALNAIVQVASAAGRRTVPIERFFEGPFMTALGEDEMVVEVVLPAHEQYRCTYEEVAIRAGDFALTGVAAALRVDEADHVLDVRIAVSGAAATPVRAADAEEVLRARGPTEDAIRNAGAVAAQATSPADDVHGSADYRRHLAEVLTCRALRKVSGRQDTG